jgi:DNA topoisomerase-3
MKLVIAEKPSVARDLARVLGAGSKRDGALEGADLVITWCIGHLVELDDPASYDPAWKAWRMDLLPMVPASFRLRARKEGHDQWAVVRRLLQERRFTSLVNACDAGREGELIFRYVVELAGCKLPVERFWVSSMTDEAIRNGWANLRPGRAFDALADAARCRSEADWLVGLNATRAMTVRARDAGGDALWSIGRVQTPTLAMIVARDRAIAAFVPETFWQVKATFQADGDGDRARPWTATLFRASDAEPKPAGGDPAEGGGEPEEVDRAERVDTEAAALALVDAARGATGVVERAHRQARTERPPLLYDLTALQRRANQRYGMSADRTLEIAQALYERHKLITYPRTDARHLTRDQVGEIPGILRAVGQVPVYAPFAQALGAAPLRVTPRWVNDAEVGDHHAILPTARPPHAGLEPDEKRIYDLVVRRLLAVLSADAVFDVTDLVVAVPPRPDVTLPAGWAAPLRFRARGRVCRELGWRAIDPPGASKDTDLPPVEVGDAARATKVDAHEGQTRPPRPMDDASLLQAMETAGRSLEDAELKRAMRHAGLGTPATRAAILTTLIERKYARREGRALHATDKGGALIDAIPVDELKSAELTGRWEKRLADVAEGRDTRAAFQRDVVEHVHRVIDALRGAAMPAAAVVREGEPAKSLGACPTCGQPVRARGPVFVCDTGRPCGFVVFASMAKRKIGPTLVQELLKQRRTKAVDGFMSKSGSKFSAGLCLGEGDKVQLWFPDRDAGSARGAPTPSAAPRASAGRPAPSTGAPAGAKGTPAAPRTPEGMACPLCARGTVLVGHAAWGCSRWREGCGWRMPFVEDGQPLDPVDAARRLQATASASRSAAPRKEG